MCRLELDKTIGFFFLEKWDNKGRSLYKKKNSLMQEYRKKTVHKYEN